MDGEQLTITGPESTALDIFIQNIVAIFNTFIGAAADVATTVLSYPLLLLGVLVPITFIGVRFFIRILRRR